MERAKFDTIRSLISGSFRINSDDTIDYLSGQTPLTEAEIDAEYNATQYQRDREPNYPNLAEQFDLLWHAIDADTLDKTSDFYTTLKAVKDAHPKG